MCTAISWHICWCNVLFWLTKHFYIFTVNSNASWSSAFVTSDEQENTISISEGLKLLTSILPKNAFFGEGSKIGPSIVMIEKKCADDSLEVNGTSFVYIHFLQRRWTWLHDSKNGVRVKQHRIELIKGKSWCTQRQKIVSKSYTHPSSNVKQQRVPSVHRSHGVPLDVEERMGSLLSKTTTYSW